MHTVERYWYLAVLIILAAVFVWLIVVRSRTGGAPRSNAGCFSFGPFWPTVDRYLNRRGGFSPREWLGWGMVLLVAMIAVVFFLSRN
jgi:hypothetical protein